MADGYTVGAVNIKVHPNTKGFRRRVEAELAGLRDAEMGVDPKTAGLRKRIEAAAAGARSKLRVDVDSRNIRDQLRREAAKTRYNVKFDAKVAKVPLLKSFQDAAKDFKVVPIRQMVELQFTENGTANRKNQIVSIRKDMEFLKDLSKHVTFATLGKSLEQTSAAAQKVKTSMDSVRRSVKGVRDSHGVANLATSMRGLGKALAVADAGFRTTGKSMKWATGGYVVDRKLHAWLDLTKNKTADATERLNEFKKAQKQLAVDRSKDAVARVSDLIQAKANERAKNAVKNLHKEIDAYKEFDKYFKAFHPGKNKKVARSFAPIRDEAKAIEHLFKSLSGMSAGDLDKALPQLSNRIQDFRKELGASIAEQEDFRKRMQGITSDVRKASRMEKFNIPGLKQTLDNLKAQARDKKLKILDATSIKRSVNALDTATALMEKFDIPKSREFDDLLPVKKLKEQINEFKAHGEAVSRYVKRVRKGLTESFNTSPAGAQVGKLKDRIKELNNFLDNNGFYRFRKEIKRTTVETQKVETVTKRITRVFRNVGKSANYAGSQVRRFNKPSLWQRLNGNMEKLHPERRYLGLTRVGWLVAAVSALVVPAIGLISGALMSLPALGLAAGAALGVTLLGLEGIKTAAQAAAPGLNNLKAAVSGVFAERLTPQFAELNKLMFAIEPNTKRVANGMADFSRGIVSAVTSGKGLKQTQTILDRTGDLMSNLEPFANKFTSGLMTMAEAGTRTFPALSKHLNNFGETFDRYAERISEDGTLQRGIETTYRLVGSFGNNIGKMLAEGLEVLPSMEPGITSFFDGIGQGVSDLMPLFGSMSNSVLGVVGELASELGDLGVAIGPGLSSFFESTREPMMGFVDAIGGLAGSLGTPLASFFEGLGPGLGETLELLAGGLDKVSDSIDGLSGAEGKISGLNDAMESFGRTAGEFVPSMLGKFNESSKELKESAPKPEDYSGFLGFAAFSFDTYISDIKRSVSKIKEAFAGAESQQVEIQLEALASWKVVNEGDLSAVVAQFTKEATVAAEGLKIDIQPQLNVLDAASSVEEANAAMDSIRETLKQASEEPPVETTIEVEPKAEVSPSTDLGAAMQEATIPAKESLTTAFEGLGTDLGATVDTELQGAMSQVDTAVATAAQGIGTSLGDALGGIDIDISGMTTQLSSAIDELVQGVVTDVQTLGDEVGRRLAGITVDISSATAGMASEVASSTSDIPTAFSDAFNGVPDIVSGAMDGIPSSVEGAMTQVSDAVSRAGDEAESSMTDSFKSMSNEVTSTATTMASTVKNTLKMDLTSSGSAVGSTFASGLRSKIGEVSAAARDLAAAARTKFPNSPAKEGPFSGSGWIGKSGDSVGIAFADGLKRQTGAVGKAASNLVGAARAEFNDIATAPEATMRSFQREKILRPVRENNAKAFADFRKANEKAEENHAKRLADIHKNSAEQQAKAAESVAKSKSKSTSKNEQLAKRNASISENEAKNIARADENLQKQLERNRENLEKRLQSPDFSDINLSVNEYWINGLKELFTEKLMNIVRSTGVSHQLKAAAKVALAKARKQFGNHPLMARIEANIDSKHFNWAVEKAIEESGIAAVPVEFVVTNADQLKSDLGMGDGVISRGIDAALDFNANETDAKAYREYKEANEIHYHVEDMNEAIRLEKLRERKAMMKMRR